MVLTLLRKLFKTSNERVIKYLEKTVQDIESLDPVFSKYSDEELKSKTASLKNELALGKTLDDLLVPAFATVREMAIRVIGIKHFPVQLLGGIVLHKGMIAEMKTGEGKTLVATLPAYLNALNGKGVHIVTVNDYLAQRDAEWMGKIFTSLGLTVGTITNNSFDETRAQAYQADILYATNNELGFDYLKDNMKFSKNMMIQRNLNFAIIDEVDSILIDEARTPLIISGPVDEDIKLYTKIDSLIKTLDVKEDVDIEEKTRSVNLTESGTEKLEATMKKKGIIDANSGLYDIDNVDVIHHLDQALKANMIFVKDRDYIIKDNKVVIVDEFTGRMMNSRRFSDGLHQALEAKEKVKINQENQTLASITFQNYFRLYGKICGMTGTALTEAHEFEAIYNLQVIQIPTNLPVKRIDAEDEVYCSEREKLDAILTLVTECHKKNQPVLVGTTDIKKSEKLSALFKKHKLPHSVLNARYHEQEAQIIAQAGKPAKITIATNMAGRGTDIQLGGNLEVQDLRVKEKEAHDLRQKRSKMQEEVRKAGGLYIIGTERHESRRIDNQLRGRAGRQGDPGSSKFFLSLEDDLLRIFGSNKIGGFLQKLGLKDGEAIYHPWITKAIERAQRKVEARNYEIRKALLKFDDVMNQQRKAIFAQRNAIMDNKNNVDLNTMAINVDRNIVNNAVNRNIVDQNSIETEFSKIYGQEITLGCLEERTEIQEFIKKRSLEIIALKEQYCGDDLMQEIKKRIMLVTLDQLWREHLYALDNLKKGINLMAIAQKDPLNEYKREVFIMFSNMLKAWEETVISRIARLKIDERIE